MTLSFGVTTRHLSWAVLSALGALGCQEPGADWVPTDESTTTTTSTVTSDGGSMTSATNATSSTNGTATSDGTSNGTSNGGAATATSSTGAGGSGGQGASNATGTDATTDSSTGTTTTLGSTTGSAGSGGGSGSSLITNGDFSAGEADWSFSGSGSVDTGTGEYCVTLSADGEVSVGWPNGVDAAGLGPDDYQLSYRAHFTGSAAPTLIAKVGQAFEPYQAFVEENAALGSSPMTFTHAFSVDSEEQAGVLFRVQGATGDVVCFDDVVLAAQ